MENYGGRLWFNAAEQDVAGLRPDVREEHLTRVLTYVAKRHAQVTDILTDVLRIDLVSDATVTHYLEQHAELSRLVGELGAFAGPAIIDTFLQQQGLEARTESD